MGEVSCEEIVRAREITIDTYYILFRMSPIRLYYYTNIL